MNMGHLSKQDHELARALRLADVFQNVTSKELDLSEGVIIVPCADGDQMPDLFTYELGLFAELGIPPRVHEIALNGGALLIPRDSKVRRDGSEDRVLLQHLRDAQALKGIDLVMLYAHAPCGAAALAELDLRGVVSLLMAAKSRVKAEVPSLKVACFLHIDWGDGKKRTYFVSRDKWECWNKQ